MIFAEINNNLNQNKNLAIIYKENRSAVNNQSHILQNQEHYNNDPINIKKAKEFSEILKEEFDLINNIKLKFNKDKDTGQTFIQIIDKDTGKTIREIPPEDVRKLAQKLDEMVGLLFDKTF